MADDDLPSDYDVIVVGTGMPECMLAAAAARIGKKVLHLDRNPYYGSEWASFNFDQLCDWITEQKSLEDQSNELPELRESEQSLLAGGETAVPVPRNPKNVWNVCHISCIKEEEEPQDSRPPAAVEDNASDDQLGDTPAEQGDGQAEPVNTEETASPEAAEATPPQGLEEPASGGTSSSEQGADACPPQSTSDAKEEWTLSKLRSMKRKFNIDLSPKLLFSRGPLVELLISSNIARYAEFKSVTRVLTHIDGHLEQVPCSRADVFSTKHVSVAEKRMLMKLLTFAIEFHNYPNEYRGYEGSPFIEFLQSKKLTPNVKHYVIHAIAMVDEQTPTLQALKSTQKFLESLGRYGNSPFIWPLFGSAELPQCFCRLCAVYGGIYYLKRSVDHVILDASSACKGILSNGKRMNCSWLVMEPSYMPEQFTPPKSSRKNVSRGIFITDSSMLCTEREQLTLLRLPFAGLGKTPVTVLELGPGSMVCPQGLYVVHMTMPSKGDTAKEDLMDAAKLLFQPFDDACGSTTKEATAAKPRVLWAVFFNQVGNSDEPAPRSSPSVIPTLFPDAHVDYEHVVNEVKKKFEEMFPGEPFLPRAPDPEEIVIESDNNPGTEQADVKEEAASESAPPSGVQEGTEETHSKPPSETCDAPEP